MARVLVIDDEPTIVMVLEIALSEEGHEVATALDGLTGLNMMKQSPLPDIVLLDLYMPGLSGQAVANTMRSDPVLKDIPVVIISGSIPNPDNFPRRDSYQALITKPFDLHEVLSTIETLVAKGRVA